jgi:4a-hydroxytetrahydrobiopterin dehydratase
MDVLKPSRVDEVLAGGLGWERRGNELVKVESREDFAAALAYVNEVGRLAEEMGHHPDIEIRWNTVTLRLSTHSAGGITERDLELARRIDAIGG